MCGRTGFSTGSSSRLGKAFGVGIEKELFAMLGSSGRRQNHAPTMLGAVYRAGHDLVEAMHWGIMTAAYPDRPPRLQINARSETVSIKPTFREAWRHRRCLVASDYFYEWDESTPKHLPRQPWRFSLDGGEPMIIAAIWSPLTLKDGRRVDGYAVLTTNPAPTVAAVHDRMPVILHERDWKTWIDERTPHEELKVLLRAYDGPMTAAPVTVALNKSTYQGPVEEVVLRAEPFLPKQGELF